MDHLIVQVQERLHHGFRVRVVLVRSTDFSIRLGQTEFLTYSRIEERCIPVWQQIAQSMGWDFVLNIYRLDSASLLPYSSQSVSKAQKSASQQDARLG